MSVFVFFFFSLFLSLSLSLFLSLSLSLSLKTKQKTLSHLIARLASRHASCITGSGTDGILSSNGSMMTEKPEVGP